MSKLLKGKSVMDYVKSKLKDPNRWGLGLAQHYSGDFSYATVRATDPISEDQSQVEVGENGLFVGIYDGHVSPYAAKFLNKKLFKNIVGMIKTPQHVSQEVLVRAIQDIEVEYINEVMENLDDPKNLLSGSGCLLCFVYQGTLVFANLGKSGIAIGSELEPGVFSSMMVTRDHDLSNGSHGEEYKNSHEDDPDCIRDIDGKPCVKRIPGIHISGAIGSLCLKEERYRAIYHEKLVQSSSSPLDTLAQPISRPYLKVEPLPDLHHLIEGDKHVILASGGFWELLSHEEASNIIFEEKKKEGIAELLLKKAIKKAVENRVESYAKVKTKSHGRSTFHGDMTVVVIFMDHASLHKRNQNVLAYSYKPNDHPSTSNFSHLDLHGIL